MNRPFDLYEHNKTTLKTDADILDILTIVDGLIDVSVLQFLRKKIRVFIFVLLLDFHCQALSIAIVTCHQDLSFVDWTSGKVLSNASPP